MDTPYEIMEGEWGTRCPEYHPRCFCCVAWRMFDGGEGVPDVEKVIERIAITGGRP